MENRIVNDLNHLFSLVKLEEADAFKKGLAKHGSVWEYVAKETTPFDKYKVFSEYRHRAFENSVEFFEKVADKLK